MATFRFLLILGLTVALDLSSPVPQPGAAEMVEEFEEVIHTHRGRRPFRLVRDTVPAVVAREVAVVEVHAPPPVAGGRRPASSRVVIRKVPPPGAESSAAPEDH